MKESKSPKKETNPMPRYLFIITLALVLFGYGYMTHRNHIFPYTFLQNANEGFNWMMAKAKNKKRSHYQKTTFTEVLPTYEKGRAQEGLSLVTSIIEDERLSASIINMDGEVIQQWNIDWFEMWGDATHIPERDMPKERPGTVIHGAVVLENGNLVFNFEPLGLVCIDVCSNIVWRLPYRTHHSVHVDESGNLWVSGRIVHEQNEEEKRNNLEGYPFLKYPVFEEIVLTVSPDGDVLNEISITDLFRDNGLQSMLFMSSISNSSPHVTGDLLHLNDVETFPADMEPGVFEPGDIMMSLRNINAVVVFNGETKKIKQLIFDDFVRQHDPDFIDGNTISIFDNNNSAPHGAGHFSSILVKSFDLDSTYVYYTGSKDHPFYTAARGKHQWLPNGNCLIMETERGRAFEIDSTGHIVWEFINLLEDGYTGIVTEVHRLPKEFDEPFFRGLQSSCPEKED